MTDVVCTPNWLRTATKTKAMITYQTSLARNGFRVSSIRGTRSSACRMPRRAQPATVQPMISRTMAPTMSTPYSMVMATTPSMIS